VRRFLSDPIVAAKEKHFSAPAVLLKPSSTPVLISECSDEANWFFCDPRIASCGGGTAPPDCEIARNLRGHLRVIAYRGSA